MSDESDGGQINRRSVLQVVGGISVGSLSSSMVAAAEEVAAEVKELSGNQKDQVVRKARREPAYDQLRTALSRDEVTIESEEPNAYLIKKQGIRVAIFDIDTGNDGEWGYIAVPVTANGKARASIKRFDEENGPEEFVQYHVDFEPGKSEQARNDGVTVETLSTDEGDVNKAVIDFDDLEEADVTTQGVNLSCDHCKKLVAVVNQVSCSVYDYIICNVATSYFAWLGWLSCTIAVGIICLIVLNWGVTKPSKVCSIEEEWSPTAPC